MNLPDHVIENKASWEIEAANYVENAKRNWATDEISWGIFGVPESDIGALPDVDGMDVVELGCGTAYLSAWLARRGARRPASTSRTTSSPRPARCRPSMDWSSR
jgi:2-polyprenyl-3-methyl-5-hydroxy-6-metoxy-1,4-benzoquinol methylase